MSAKTVMVTDTFKVEIDSLTNHVPYVYKMVEHKDNTESMQWRTCDKYFGNLARAIHYGVEQGYCGLDDLVGDVTLYEYVTHLEAIYDQTQELLRSMVKPV